MRIITLLISILCYVLIISACTFAPVKPEAMTTYTLDSLKIKAAASAPINHPTIIVSDVSTDPAYKKTDMLYSEAPHQLKPFTRNRWIAPPAQMLTPLVAESLRSKGYFTGVITPPFIGKTDLRLDTQLLSFQQEFVHPFSLFKMSMEAVLTDNTTRKIIASRHFDVVIPAPQNNPYGGVIAANKATAAILQQIAEFSVRAAKITAHKKPAPTMSTPVATTTTSETKTTKTTTETSTK